MAVLLQLVLRQNLSARKQKRRKPQCLHINIWFFENFTHIIRVIPRQINQCYPPHHLGLPWYFFFDRIDKDMLLLVRNSLRYWSSIWPSMEAQVVPLVAVSAAVEWDSFSTSSQPPSLEPFQCWRLRGGWDGCRCWWFGWYFIDDLYDNITTCLFTNEVYSLDYPTRERTLKAVNQSDWISQPSNQSISNK